MGPNTHTDNSAASTTMKTGVTTSARAGTAEPLDQRSVELATKPVMIGAAIALYLVTIPFLEILLGARTAMWSDINAALVPRYSAVWQNIRSGSSPFWWKSLFSGFNTLGAGQSAVFYLPNAIFGWLSPVTAFRWWLLGHIWFGAIGWYLWSLWRWRSIPGAVVSALAGTLSGFAVYHLVHLPFVASLAWIPWVLLLLDRTIERRGWIHPALLAFSLAAIAVIGHPVMIWFVGIIVVVTVAMRTISRRSNWRDVLHVYARVATGCALGFSLAAVQLIPQLSFGRTGIRELAGRDYFLDHAAAPRHLLTLVSPSIMGGSQHALWWSTPWRDEEIQHELANYLGIPILVLAVIGAVRLRRDRRVQSLLIVAAFGVLTALGRRTPVADFVFDTVPFADRFRVWSRNLVLLNVAIACLAGAGVREIAREPRRLARYTVYSAATLAVVMAVLPAATDLDGALVTGTEGALARFLPVVFLLLTSLAFALYDSRHHQRAVALLVTLCLIDLSMFAISAPWRGEGLRRERVEALYAANNPSRASQPGEPLEPLRWLNDDPRFFEDFLPSGISSATGFDPLLQTDYARTAGRLNENGSPLSSAFWRPGWLSDVLRVRVLASADQEPTDPRWRRSSSSLESWMIWSYEPRLAGSYLVGEAKVRSLDQARAGIYDPNTPLTEFAYVDTTTIDSRDTPRFAQLAQPGPSGTVINGAMDDGGHGRWTVNAERPSLFVTSYAWMEGWTATVDGQPVPVARTNALVLGVPVPAGQHEVQLTFTPPGWTTGRNITIIALTITLLILALDNQWGRSTVTALRRLVRRPARSRDSATTTS